MAAVTDRNKTTRSQPVLTPTMSPYAQAGTCSFIPEVSHAIIIKQRNRSLCDTGSVRKSRKINGFTQLSGYTTVIIPLLNSLSLANHDMRKTWYCV